MVLVILALGMIYKPVYKVRFLGEDLGYVNNKEEVTAKVNEYLNNKEGNVAFVDIKAMPEYTLEIVKNIEYINVEEVLKVVKENSKTIYREYAITVEGEKVASVKTNEEAETVINRVKDEYGAELIMNMAIVEELKESIDNVVTIDVAVEKAANTKIVTVARAKMSYSPEGTVNGISLMKPVEGTVSSRFGIRDIGNHTGIDIPAPIGTGIKVASSGTVISTDYSGGYGNLIVVDHGNGVETYYAHCNLMYVSVGETVEGGQIIGEVGVTGWVTGAHLHFEIRINNAPQDPQNYIY